MHSEKSLLLEVLDEGKMHIFGIRTESNPLKGSLQSNSQKFYNTQIFHTIFFASIKVNLVELFSNNKFKRNR